MQDQDGQNNNIFNCVEFGIIHSFIPGHVEESLDQGIEHFISMLCGVILSVIYIAVIMAIVFMCVWNLCSLPVL